MTEVKAAFCSPPDLSTADVEPGSGFIAWSAARHYLSTVKTNVLDNLVGVHYKRLIKISYRKQFIVKQRDSQTRL